MAPDGPWHHRGGGSRRVHESELTAPPPQWSRPPDSLVGAGAAAHGGHGGPGSGAEGAGMRGLHFIVSQTTT